MFFIIDIFMQRHFYWEDTFKLLRNLKVGHERIIQHLSGNADKNLKYIAAGIEQVIAVLLWGLDNEEKGDKE